MMNTTQNKDKIPVMRELDGIYFRVHRNGKKCDRCFSDLTPNERKSVLERYDTPALKSMCYILADTIRSLGDTLNLVGYEPVMPDKEVLSQTEFFEDVYLMILRDKNTDETDAVMVWNKDGDLESSANEILVANAENRKPENRTDTITIELEMELMVMTEQWCEEHSITLEQFFYAFIEFCVQPQHQNKVNELMKGYKNE